MRIAVIHSFYSADKPSGENIAVLQQIAALRSCGMEVHEIFRFTDELEKRPTYKYVSALRVATGLDFDSPLQFINKLNPDIVHVHNTFPNFGNRWLRKCDAPIITTLHNFRSSCANGLLFRGGNVCLDCPTSGSQSAVIHACYRGSSLASLPLAMATAGGVKGNHLLNSSSAVIAQSTRVYSFMRGQGLTENKLHLIPGFVERFHTDVTDPPVKHRFLFVGRDSPEKGLWELLKMWPQRHTLDIVGVHNPVGSSVTISENINFLGIKSREFVTSILPSYTGVVFPGRVWEGAYPLVVREALEASVPVVALKGSSAADLIIESGAGFVYDDASLPQLSNALDNLIEGGMRHRVIARQTFLSQLDIDTWVKAMTSLFRTVISDQ